MFGLKIIVAGVLVISILTFGALFGRLPAFRKGPAGWLYRLIWNTTPTFFYKLDGHLTGGRISSSLRRLSRYLMNENHPLVLIFFLSILLGSQLLFVPASFSQLDYFHKFLTSTLCIIPYIFIFKCVTSTTSYIIPANHWQQMHQYPYDHVLFHPKQVCRTCHLLKPARSKHCNLCKGCVARHDHHCIWIMNCVGKGNHVHFLGMLLSLAILLSYGGFLTHHVLTKILQETFLSNQSPGPKRLPMKTYWSKGMNWSEYLEGWLWALTRDVRIGGVGMLAVLTAPLAWGFFLYHVYLIWAGMTTNESAKWADWRDDIADGLVFRSDRREGITGPTGDFSEDMTELCVDWPISSNQLLARCGNGQPPYDHHLEGLVNGRESPSRGVSRWKKVGHLNEIDNLYDLGFWDNLTDALGAGVSLFDDHESTG